jgi:hypothetical protein
LSPTAAGGNSRIASLEVLERELDAATRITSRIQRVRITLQPAVIEVLRGSGSARPIARREPPGEHHAEQRDREPEAGRRLTRVPPPTPASADGRGAQRSSGRRPSAVELAERSISVQSRKSPSSPRNTITQLAERGEVRARRRPSPTRSWTYLAVSGSHAAHDRRSRVSAHRGHPEAKRRMITDEARSRGGGCG